MDNPSYSKCQAPVHKHRRSMYPSSSSEEEDEPDSASGHSELLSENKGGPDYKERNLPSSSNKEAEAKKPKKYARK